MVPKPTPPWDAPFCLRIIFSRVPAANWFRGCAFVELLDDRRFISPGRLPRSTVTSRSQKLRRWNNRSELNTRKRSHLRLNGSVSADRWVSHFEIIFVARESWKGNLVSAAPWRDGTHLERRHYEPKPQLDRNNGGHNMYNCGKVQVEEASQRPLSGVET